jgi:hypothetical protein
VEDGPECLFFLFLAGLNPTSNPTLINPNINRAYFLGFWGGIYVMIRGMIRIGVILWSFLVILPPILPRILPQSYQNFVEIRGLVENGHFVVYIGPKVKINTFFCHK